MKYGNIIYDPTSEEAKKLVGKKVVGGCSYKTLENMPDELIEKTLLRIGDSMNPFEVDDTKFTFVREVVKEKPTYRPYKDCEEMAEDYKKRFYKYDTFPPHAMPLIWLRSNSGGVFLVCAFTEKLIKLKYGYEGLSGVFNSYTYLDGTPVGKLEVTDDKA